MHQWLYVLFSPGDNLIKNRMACINATEEYPN